MAKARKKVLNAFDRNRVRKKVKGKSKTEQHHAKSCNINTIMARYRKTGLIDHIKHHEPRFGDVSGADFQAAAILVADQVSIFEELPAHVRAFYENDPALYLTALETDEGIEELRNIPDPATLYDRDGARDAQALEENRRTQAELQPPAEASEEASE